MKPFKNLLFLTLFLGAAGGLYSQAVLTVAVVQTSSVPGAVTANLSHAADLAAEAAEAGAEFILFPELMPSGYITDRSCWDYAEAADGQTVRWLKKTAAELDAWCGTTFLEAEGKHVYNTFVLAAPDGTIAGRIRKQWLAGHEFFCTKPFKESHIIETEFGNIGVAICYEGTLRRLMTDMRAAGVDLVLLPTADPVPEFARDDSPEDWDHDLTDTAVLWASVLGAPALLANQAGSWKAKMPGLLPDQDSFFRGQSAIADADGSLAAYLGQEEGIALAVISLGDHPGTDIPRHGRYCKPMPFLSRVYQVFVSAAGVLSYGLSSKHRSRALERSGGEL